MAPKRRMLVIFEPGDGSDGRKRIIVSIDANATNADLAREIATTLNQTQPLTLEIAGGFELRGQDGVEVIHEGDIVTAKPSTQLSPSGHSDSHPELPTTNPAPPDPASVTRGPDRVQPIHEGDVSSTKLYSAGHSDSRPELPTSNTAHPDPVHIPQQDESCRMQIRLVTAELARNHAVEEPNEFCEPTNGVLAFEGELVNGNTTLHALQREAARIFGWTSADDNLIDEESCQHGQEGACSCAIAQEIVQNGLFSTLHCRFALDGSNCSNSECPYSHVELNGEGEMATLPPHCSLCDEALGFPCPTCIHHANESGIQFESLVYCPLIQNAGCGHLHHAHCLGPQKDAELTGCPSGCLPEIFPREAAVLDMDQRHLIVAWDGDKIDKVPIPFHEAGYPEGSSISLMALATDVVISLIETFLSSKNYALPGLSVRLHSRDPVTETVRLTQSTLVSVCSATTHTNQNHRRFELFSERFSTPHNPSTRVREFVIDLHTSQSPIVACGCTSLKQLFAASEDAEGNIPPSSVVLYVVRRRNEPARDTEDSEWLITSQETYLASTSWQPSIMQSPRGMAALLSSLYLLAHSVAQKGIDGEQKILAVMYAITRFPPAVRALGSLFINRTPQPEEKAALSEALFHAINDFSSSGPPAITSDPSRRFETIRILLAHVWTARDAPSSPSEIRAIENVSLICAASHKQLTDPVILDSLIVQRGLSLLRQRGGELYRPSTTKSSVTIAELTDTDSLRQLLSCCRALRSKSTLALNVKSIGLPPPSCSCDLASVGRDFIAAIQRANETDLVTRGPLELKAADVIAPQIVLDEEGLLAVFTGRACAGIFGGGCGAPTSSRDVIFFRPTTEGDTEVDVNDVSYLLEQVILTRQAEGTWQIDNFGGVSAPPRPPDEAIVLCLDLSESMNNPSGVSRPAVSEPDVDEFIPEAEAVKAVEALVSDLSDDTILFNARKYLDQQHPSCHHAWKASVEAYSKDDQGLLTSSDVRSPEGLIIQLGTMARRDVLRLTCILEEHPRSRRKGLLVTLACFVTASSDHREALVHHLVEILDGLVESEILGVAPYDAPRHLIDPRTGDLLLDPVCPNNAPNQTTFVNRDSLTWFESQADWPIGHFVTSLSSLEDVRQAVATWISGSDLLSRREVVGRMGTRSNVNNVVRVTLQHEGQETVWNLSTAEPTRTLYTLVNRVTRAKYSSFTLRLHPSNTIVTDSAHVPLRYTFLSHGGTIEISRAIPHSRRLYEIDVVVSDQSTRKLLLPRDASTLSLLSYMHARGIDRMSGIVLWNGLKKYGDGVRRGKVVYNETNLRDFVNLDASHSLTFECDTWFWPAPVTRKKKETNPRLSRLHLLNELFNCFLDRAGSFDTSVSLAVGLVTFSDQAVVQQEPVPVFENLRRQLDRVTAGGDTAVYDALDLAQGVLVNFRRDLPNLRKRIIIVSDGEDTSSRASAREVCFALQRNKILVDSVQVGTSSNRTLRAISVATGGYRICPKTSLADALSIFDLETMLHSAERPHRRVMPLVFSDIKLWEYGSTFLYPIDVVTVDRFPQRAEHAKLQQRVRLAEHSVVEGLAHDDRLRRIMQEIKIVIADPHPQIDVYVNDQDIGFLKIILEAPTDVEKCPYKGGTFLLTCDFPQGYPRDPPEIRFVTFILHPNVSKQGKVCVAELQRLWSSDITLKEIFTLIYGLLLEPDLDNPLELQASLKYYDDDGTFALDVANAVREHASKSRTEWGHELEDQ